MKANLSEKYRQKSVWFFVHNVLALFPPAVLVLIAITTPEVGRLYSGNPLFLSPVILGSGISYWLSMRMIRNGLSIEASMGLQSGGQGEIRLDRLGRVL